MDLGPTSTPQKGRGRRGKGPYIGVRLRGGRWVSEIRIPKTKTRIWLGSHLSAEKAARAYDAALYCLKGDQASFNFPNNRRPNLANRSVGSLNIEEIQGIAAEFSRLDEPRATSEPSPMSPVSPDHLSPVSPDHLSPEEPLVLPEPQSPNKIDANKVDGESHAPTEVPEVEPYFPKMATEEPQAPAYVPEAALMLVENFQLDEFLALGMK